MDMTEMSSQCFISTCWGWKRFLLVNIADTLGISHKLKQNNASNSALMATTMHSTGSVNQPGNWKHKICWTLRRQLGRCEHAGVIIWLKVTACESRWSDKDVTRCFIRDQHELCLSQTERWRRCVNWTVFYNWNITILLSQDVRKTWKRPQHEH